MCATYHQFKSDSFSINFIF